MNLHKLFEGIKYKFVFENENFSINKITDNTNEVEEDVLLYKRIQFRWA